VNKSLPKGHVSCLSEAFRYTSAADTSLAKTFARVRRRVKQQPQEQGRNVCVLPQRKVGQP